MGIITALEVQKRNKKRVNVFVDDDYAFSLSLDEAARLHKGQTLSDAEIAALIEQSAITAATDSAARFMAMRPRSAYEVRQNLMRKQTPPPVIDAVLEKLNEFGYIDDRAFAELWVRDRTTFKPTSPRALRYELRQKGISDSIIDAVLTELDADDAAYRAAQSQVRRLRGVDRREFRTKVSTLLQRRGFSYDVIRATTRRLFEELDAESPDFFAGDSEDDDDIPE